MGTFSMVLQLLLIVLGVVRNVEDVVQGARRGEVKKQQAVEATERILDGVATTGAMSADDAAKGKRLAPKAIDLVVDVLNEAGVFRRSTGAA